MNNWSEVTLGDLCSRVTVGHVGKMADEYVENGVPFLRSQNVRPFVIEPSGMLQISESFHQKLCKSRLRAGDVVVVRTGYPGTAAVIPEHLDGSNCADLVVITPSELINGHLLAAVFNSVWGKSAVGSQLVGSAQQHFNVGSAKALRVRLPDRYVQDKIAAVLCVLNDSIENNRRRVEVLEEMAQAIYREWFVHFRYPGHENAKLVNSSIGEVPEGWSTVPLFEAADVGFGFSFKSARFSDVGPYPVIRIRDVPAGITRTFSDERPDERYSVRDSDVLIGMDGVFHLRQWRGGDAWLNQRVARLRPENGMSGLHLMLGITRQIVEWNGAIVGTTVAHLGKRHLEQVRLLVPPEGLLQCITPFFDDVARQACSLDQTSRQLAVMRDLLLPKLVTGQIDVSSLDLDALVESSVA